MIQVERLTKRFPLAGGGERVAVNDLSFSVAAGEVYDLMHDHDKARGEYLAVVAAGPDTSQADLARKYMRSAYNP